MVRLIPASKRGLPAWILAGVRVTAVLGQEPRKSQPSFPAFVWKSEPPAGCPFEHSRELTGIEFLGVHSDYRFADTWYL
jgi:hypothetical protein